MKAILISEFGGPENLKLVDVPDPHAGAGQVVVELKAIGINPVETYVRRGIYGPKSFPYTPGSDGAGVVREIGKGVEKFQVGQRVYISGSISGSYAALSLCEAAQVHPLPEAVSFAQGASVGVPYATAYRALFIRGRARAGQTLLVHGATGGVGVAAVQLAAAAGIDVIGTGGTARGRTMVIEQGAHHALDHHAPDYLQRAMTLTGERGFDVILEMASHINLDKDLGILAKGGCVVVVGSRGKVEIDPRQTMARDTSIVGMSLNNADARELAAIHAALGAGLSNGTLRPIVGREMPLAQAAAAQKAVIDESAFGKIALIP